MKTLEKERDVLRILHKIAARCRTAPGAKLARSIAEAFAKLRQERTNAQRYGDAKAGALIGVTQELLKRSTTVHRLRQERDAYKAEVEWRTADCERVERIAVKSAETANSRLHKIAGLAEGNRKLRQELHAHASGAILSQTIAGRDREHALSMQAIQNRDDQIRKLNAECVALEKSAVKYAKRIDRCLRTMRKQSRENDALQKDRDEIFVQLKSAYATCETLRYQLEEGADVETDAHIVELQKTIKRVQGFSNEWRDKYETLQTRVSDILADAHDALS